MIENNKCILAYGLSNVELEYLEKLQYKLIEITPEMGEMILKDILSGIRLEIFNRNPIREKVIIYSNFPESELKATIELTRKHIKDSILSIVTEESIKWKVNYLISNLVEERNWYLKIRKENRDE